MHSAATEDAPLWPVLLRRPLFRCGFLALLLLYGVAALAPLIANDRPLVFEGVNVRAFASASSSLRSVAAGLERRARQTEAEYEEELRAAGTRGDSRVPQTLAGALRQERAALATRLELLAGGLVGAAQERELAGRLDAFAGTADEALACFAAADPDGAATAAGRAKGLASELRDDLRPLDPARPEAGGLDLVARRSYPLLDALGPMDVFWAVLWLALSLGLLGAALRPASMRWRRMLGASLGLSAIAAAAHGMGFGGGEDMHIGAPFKPGLVAGDLHAIAAGGTLSDADTQPGALVWAPLPYGVAESHREEGFRPPTWTSAAEIDERGRRVHAAVKSGEAEPVLTPVEIRAGEPARNAWNRHLLGTDNQGRDLLVRLIWGARTSLTVGILSALLLVGLGVTVGALAGTFGGWVDAAALRVIEVLQSIPALFLVLISMAFVPPDVVRPIVAIVVVIALVRWTGVARLVRAEFLRLREAEFVLAARALGYSEGRIALRHILPNALGPVLVSAAFAVAAGILTESAVSFLGLGVSPPQASWGGLILASRSPVHWWIQVFPGLAIFVTVTCYNLVGDALRDVPHARWHAPRPLIWRPRCWMCAACGSASKRSRGCCARSTVWIFSCGRARRWGWWGSRGAASR